MAQRSRDARAAMMLEDQPSLGSTQRIREAPKPFAESSSLVSRFPASKETLDASAWLQEPHDEVEMTRKRKRRRLLTPDPDSTEDDFTVRPSLQLPTPPPSQHKKTHSRLSIADFDLRTALSEGAEDIRLPAEYETVLAQHAALERGLVLHLATEGGRAAGTIASTTTDASGTLRARLPNILSFSAAKKMIEGGSRKRLEAPELARLKWIWDLSPPVGYIVSSMKELDSTGKKASTWGLGIELTVQHHAPQPTLELVGALPASPPRTPSKTGSRDSMSIVALWSQSSEMRITEVRRRLCALASWQLRHSVSPDEFMPVPRADLPALRARTISNGSAPVTASQELLERSSSSPAKASGNLMSRASTQMERIKAKQAAKAQGMPTASVQASNGEVDVFRVETPSEKMEGLRERSALSRLAAIADGVHLLFSSSSLLTAPPSPTISVPTPPTRKRRAVPLDEMANLVAKSSRAALSDAEAKDALELLCRVSPGFISIKEIDKRLWVASVGEKSLRETKEAIKSALAH